ncbi:TVP38/TMEM64 family protein [Clostridium sp. JS66]|uniref:TVP38/TMEM64 family protein n=1 Tax=Clostridium sp. JS66 TaxID=3064705 RepID=UPI00298D8D3D|nr:VTT domain-containing protein [Clostridium sp. JS66]WPC40009.1 VTT domain-containing protein [Clostridium sp. JS66]
MDKSKKFFIFKIFMYLLGICTAVLVLKYLPNIIELTMSLDKFRNYIVSLGKLGTIVFIFFQVLQTVIAPIPGEVIQVAGGYIYDVSLGITYTTVGMLLGAIIAFYFTRFIGASFVEKLMNRNNSKWLNDIMDNKKFSIILFIIFFVPGLPKDFLIYVAGLTPIKPLKFFGILLVSRFPWLLASVTVGSNLHYRNYTSTVIIGSFALIAFVLGIIYKDKIINKLSCNNNYKESYKIS